MKLKLAHINNETKLTDWEIRELGEKSNIYYQFGQPCPPNEKIDYSCIIHPDTLVEGGSDKSKLKPTLTTRINITYSDGKTEYVFTNCDAYLLNDNGQTFQRIN